MKKQSNRALSIVLVCVLCLSFIPLLKFDIKTKAAEQSGNYQGFEYKTVDDTVWITGYNGNNSNISIPKTINGLTVVKIANLAFGDNRTFNTVTIPNTIEEIGGYAFSSCADFNNDNSYKSGLKKIIFENYSSLKIIGNYAFQDCSWLESVVLPDSVISIGDGAFRGCYSLQSIQLPKSLEKLGYQCFEQTGISSITLPKSLKEAGPLFYDHNYPYREPETISGFKFPTFVDIKFEEGIQYLPDNVFQYSNYSTIELPSSLTTIGKDCFYCTKKLETITIPNNVETIEFNAFAGSSIEKIEFGAASMLKTIGSYAFEDCYNLKSIDLPATLISISNNAFSGCSNLKEITIPKSVQSIGADAFANSVNIIYGYKGTEAERYANEENITFVSLDVPLDSENSNELLFDRDVWHFKNFGEPQHEVLGEYLVEPHKISNEDYKKLIKDIPWFSISKRLDLWANSKLAGSYGHCFGMSLSTILAKMGEFNINEISTAKYLREANLDDQVWGKICYFQMLQEKDVFQQVTQSGLALFKRDPGTYFNTLYKKASQVKDGGCPVLLGFGCQGPGGHSVVAFGAEEGSWTFDGETYDRCILIYDNNLASEAYEDDKENNPIWDEDFCLYYNSSTAHWIIPGYKTVSVMQGDKIVSFPGMIYTNETAQFADMSNDVDVLSPSRWGNKTTPYKATIEITDSNNRKLIDSFTNKEYFISGKLGDLEGKEELDSYYSSSFTEEGEPALRYVILPDETHEYKVTAEDDNCSDFAVSDDSAYLSVEADQASEIQFTLSKEIEIEGCKGEFNVALWKDAATNNEFDTYEITGNGQGEITVSVTDRGVIVEGDNLKEVSVAASDIESGKTIRDTKKGPDNASVVEFYRSGDELIVSDSNEGSSEDNESKNDLDPSVNGIVKCPDGVRWAMYKDGKVNTSSTGIFHNRYGWWRVEEGYVNFNAQSIYQNKYGWWKTTNGKVTFKENGVFQNEYGWWRVKDSKVDFKAQGIYQNQYGWWKTTNGKVTFKENGVFQNENGWWKVKNSKVDFGFTGIASNKNGTWYIKNGKVDFNKNGKVKYNNKTYTIKNGKVV